MKIPKSFKLLGRTIRVIHDATYFLDHPNTIGWASYTAHEIQLRPSTITYPIDKEQQEATFYHELIHFILYYAEGSYKGELDYMHQDEDFVSMCGNLLHQALSTMEYEAVKKKK